MRINTPEMDNTLTPERSLYNEFLVFHATATGQVDLLAKLLADGDSLFDVLTLRCFCGHSRLRQADPVARCCLRW